MKNIKEINSKDESEFSESKIERDYKFMDLNIEDIKRKGSLNIPLVKFVKEIKENEEDEEDEMKPLTRGLSMNIDSYSLLDNSDNDILPLSTLIYYSLPSFGKMSCLVLLNVNSTMYYESLGHL